MKKIIALLLCCTLIVACTDTKRYAPKEGRLTVFEAKVPTLAKGTVNTDTAQTISSWPLPFYNLQNKQPHFTMNQNTELWSKKIGYPTTVSRLLPTPIVIDDTMYVLDGRNELIKLNTTNGELVWQHKISDDKIGLSLAYSDGKIFTLSTDGLLTAFDTDGKQLWQKDFAVATRAPIAVDKNGIYLLTTHNQFIVLNPKTGKEMWRYRTTQPQTLLTNMAPIAKSKGILVVPFATGEVMAFDADSGLLLWIQMMVGNRPQDLTEVPQIAAAPVIEGDTVYLSGHANFSGAHALKTGETKWTVNFGTALTPIINGNTLFMLTTQNELVALDKKTGKAFWLKVYKPEGKAWKSISLVNNELLLSDGEHLLYINPKDGTKIRFEKKNVNALPLVINGHLILMDEKTNLTFY